MEDCVYEDEMSDTRILVEKKPEAIIVQAPASSKLVPITEQREPSIVAQREEIAVVSHFHKQVYLQRCINFAYA